MATTFSLLALLRGTNEPEVRFVPLEATVQAALASEFRLQADAFLTPQMEVVPYGPGYQVESDEILQIEQFALPSSLASALRAQDAVVALTDDELETGDLRALVGALPHGRSAECLFQSFDTRQILRRGHRFLSFIRGHFEAMDRAGLQIGTHLTALHRDGSLYFGSEEMVRRFLDLDSYFREATDAELAAFGQLALWDTGAGQALAGADRWLRRKITSIKQRGVLDGQTPRGLKDLAEHFGLQLQVTRRFGRERVCLPATKKDLKLFVRLLSEDLFDSVLTGDSFLANSKRPLR